MRHRAAAARGSVLDLATGRIPTKDAGAQIAGALARKSGAAFEAALAGVNEWYDRAREAAIEKVNPPVAGWGDSLRIGASTVDYTGTFRPANLVGFDPAATACLGIAFDAKVVTGDASFGLDHTPARGKHAARNRARFLAQVKHLIDRRDRHGYAVGFLLYCAELETAWWVPGTMLGRVLAGESIPIREKRRATKARPSATIVHHLPHLHAPLERAVIRQLATGRPMLDYLSLVERTASQW